MAAASTGGGGGGCASSSVVLRAMKRELAFALQSLSEITASPCRTRSGRSLTSPALPSSPAKRWKAARSDPPATEGEAPPPDLVSPPTLPLDTEAPKAAAHHAADGLPLDALVPPEVACQDAALAPPEVASHDTAEEPALDAKDLQR